MPREAEPPRRFPKTLLHFFHHSGVVQLVAHGPLEPRILVRVQAPEPVSFPSGQNSYAAVRCDFRP